MVELVDTQDLKSCDLKSRAGSIPALSTQKQRKADQILIGFFVGTVPIIMCSNSSLGSPIILFVKDVYNCLLYSRVVVVDFIISKADTTSFNEILLSDTITGDVSVALTNLQLTD